MKSRQLVTVICLIAMAVATAGIGTVWAVTPMPDPGGVPDYFYTPNWANSPRLTKFVDTLPGLTSANQNNLGQYIPVAVPDQMTYPGSDYYEIGLKEFTERMHSDMGPTRLRGYYQINDGMVYSAATNTFVPTTADHTNHYLGPLIIAQKDRPVRIKFVNQLGPNAAGKLFVPVDTTIMGSGAYEVDYDPASFATGSPVLTTTMTGTFSQNRATLHLHGGHSPWISDGTPHQWITPAGESTNYAKGVSVGYVPDMWFDGSGNTIASCAGSTSCGVPGASNDPGPGAQTFYWTNQQSSRLMFYHDHAWGITRLNVYIGEAAGYLIQDQTEQELLNAGLIPADQIPLVIQDKTYVDESTIVNSDPTWNWGSVPGSAVTGDLWWPHVYMPAQNPYNPNMSGINDMGRWHYGPWFFPPTPVCGSSPQAVKPMCIEYGPVPNPKFDPNCDPNATFCQPPMMPGTPNPSWGAEAFLDTPIVNGTAYPTLTLQPKKYRFRILNAAHDRFLNLQFYLAVNKNGPNSVDENGARIYTGQASDMTEVSMVPAHFDPAFPGSWPTDGREGGVPDPFTAGPAFVQIGTEGGFLPAPVVLPNQPITWNVDPTMFNVGNVLQQNQGGGTLMLGPAERADVIVDFSQFAGTTLILYNDAPTAFPALDPHYDYYTNDPDRTDIGGATSTPPGFGPNVRTVMQIVVSGSGGAATPNSYDAANYSALQTAFQSSPGQPGVFARGQNPIIVGQATYNATYDTVFPFTWPYWGYSRISDNAISFVQPDGTYVTNSPMNPKAIHDEMGASFDEYGRMAARLGLEAPFTNTAIANFILQNYVDPPTEIAQAGGYQIWKITHNGVDTHPIHFHLFDVQVINRVGWDGFIRLPDPNELGWKDTVRISPLEDTIVALRPSVPTLPFKLRDSIRPLNPQTPIGSEMGFSQVDPITGNPIAVNTTNQLYNFGWEYVWHCHILSHEENDMMRAIVFQVPPDAPYNLAAANSGADVNLSWTDNSASETKFEFQRDMLPDFATQTTGTIVAPTTGTYGNTVSTIDTGMSGTTFFYRVRALSDNGASGWSNIASNAGAIGIAAAAPQALHFGNQLVSRVSPTQTVTLTNNGTATMNNISAAIGGTDFQITGTSTCGSTLAAGASCFYHIAASPSSVGAKATSLTITSDAYNSSIQVALDAVGVTPTAAVVRTVVAFADQTINLMSSAQTVTVSNTGTSNLLMTAVTITGGNTADFSQTNTCGTTVLPGMTCTVSVYFTPQSRGPRSSTMNIVTSDPVNGTIAVALSGTGVGPIAGVAPASLAFGDQNYHTLSTAQTFTLSNTGNAPLIISSIAVTGVNTGDFAQTNNCGGSVAADTGTCTITVTFTPQGMFSRSAAVTIVSNDLLSPTLNVPLSGNGVGPIAVIAPNAIAYGTKVVTKVSAEQSVTISNTGNATLSITGIALTGANATDFAISSSTCGATLAAGQNCGVGITFTPSVAGIRTASLSVTSSDPANPAQAAALSGMGTALKVLGSSLSFGNRLIGTISTAQTVTVKNLSAAAVNLSSIDVIGGDAGDFTPGLSTTCGTVLTPGQICTVTLKFRPLVVGTKTAMLSINGSDPAAPHRIALTGTGTAPINSVTPSSLTFSSQLNVTTTAQTVTVANTGTAGMTISGIALEGNNAAQFAFTSNCGTFPSRLRAGASCTVNVTFTPQNNTNTKNATLTVSVAAPAASQSVTLTGNVLAGVNTVSPASLAFGNQTIGTSSSAQTLTVTNTGDWSMRLNSITLGGTNPKQFTWVNTNCGPFPKTMAPGDSCTVDVTFRPTTAGSKSATIAVTAGNVAGTKTITLTGTGQ